SPVSESAELCDSRFGLLPCPFCGSPARTDLLPHAHAQEPGWVQCSSCECAQHMSDTLEEAVDRWNTRDHAPDQSLSVLIKQYALDLRRNASGGDDYPYEYAKATADYLEELIKRAKRSEEHTSELQ